MARTKTGLRQKQQQQREAAAAQSSQQRQPLSIPKIVSLRQMKALQAAAKAANEQQQSNHSTRDEESNLANTMLVSPAPKNVAKAVISHAEKPPGELKSDCPPRSVESSVEPIRKQNGSSGQGRKTAATNGAVVASTKSTDLLSKPPQIHASDSKKIKSPSKNKVVEFVTPLPCQKCWAVLKPDQPMDPQKKGPMFGCTYCRYTAGGHCDMDFATIEAIVTREAEEYFYKTQSGGNVGGPKQTDTLAKEQPKIVIASTTIIRKDHQTREKQSPPPINPSGISFESNDESSLIPFKETAEETWLASSKTSSHGRSIKVPARFHDEVDVPSAKSRKRKATDALLTEKDEDEEDHIIFVKVRPDFGNRVLSKHQPVKRVISRGGLARYFKEKTASSSAQLIEAKPAISSGGLANLPVQEKQSLVSAEVSNGVVVKEAPGLNLTNQNGDLNSHDDGDPQHAKTVTAAANDGTLCSLQLASHEEFKGHLRQHEDPKMEECLICGTKMWHTLLYKHQQQVHPITEPPKCIKEITAEGITVFRCSYCYKGFTDDQACRRHVETHSGGAHECKTCGKTFKWIWLLKHHGNCVKRVSTSTDGSAGSPSSTSSVSPLSAA